MTARNRRAEHIVAAGSELPGGVGAGRCQTFEGTTILLERDPTRLTALYRGAPLVRDADVNETEVRQMARAMCDWLLASQRPCGSLPYKYWPGSGSWSDADNPIRQFMATRSLIAAGRLLQDAALVSAAQANLAANLSRFYHCGTSVGVIAYDGSAKLGAAALACLAILEIEGDDGPHRAEFQALRRGVDQLWNPDGSFRTFHYPADRNDNQNFYPGEALLFWSHLWQQSRDATLADRIRQCFRFYRQWHRANRNPAFVPWHTQAYAALARDTHDRELTEWIFEMNDWLLDRQQHDGAGHPDLQGRFYDPANPQFGPPHASSTAVYLEGLAVALDLARATGDPPRTIGYAAAIRAGIRNLRQLQFTGRADTQHLSHPERVIGGIRTNPYDSAIRIDNVQHALMATLKLIELGLVSVCWGDTPTGTAGSVCGRSPPLQDTATAP